MSKEEKNVAHDSKLIWSKENMKIRVYATLCLCVLIILTFTGCPARQEALVRPDAAAQASLSLRAVKAQGDLPEILSEGDQDKYQALVEKCGVDGDETFAISSAFITAIIVKPLISFLLDGIERRTEKAIQKYTSAYATSLTLPFYKMAEASPIPTFRCLILTGGESKMPDIEVVISLIPDAYHDHLKVGAEFIRLTNAKAHSIETGQEIGLSINLKIESIWRDRNVGRKTTVADLRVLSKKVTPNGKPDFIQADAIPVPMIPYSSSGDSTFRDTIDSSNHGPIAHTGHSTITVTVAEVGTPPEGLIFFSKLFSKVEDDLAELMKSAAEVEYKDEEADENDGST